MHLTTLYLFLFDFTATKNGCRMRSSHTSANNSNSNINEWQTVSAPQKHVRTAPTQQLPSWFQELETPTNDADETTPFEPFMLMLMGLPGSGKSTIAEKLQELEPWKYVRVNQDTLKNRQACLKVAKQALMQRKCCIIDRCHASFENRKPFYQLAESCQVPVDVLIVDAPPAVCLERCRQRHNHPTVSPGDASRVINCVQKDWKLPKGTGENVRNTWTISGIDDPQFLQIWCQHLLQSK